MKQKDFWNKFDAFFNRLERVCVIALCALPAIFYYLLAGVVLFLGNAIFTTHYLLWFGIEFGIATIVVIIAVIREWRRLKDSNNPSEN